jgi:ribulose 1,5-bisphosphate synthetase/thiazole synthase
VIGACPSSLVTAKSLQEEGLEPVIFEQVDGVVVASGRFNRLPQPLEEVNLSA